MNDKTEIMVNTPEEVAYKLMLKILGKSVSNPSEEEYLNLYSKCLRVVHGELPERVLSEYA